MKLDNGYEIEDTHTCWVLKKNDRSEGWFGSKRGLTFALKERKIKPLAIKDFPDYHRGLK